MTLTNNTDQKKPDTKEYILHDSIYIQFKNRQTPISYVRSQNRKGRDGREHKRDFWDANNFIFLNPSSTYITVFTL